MAFWRNALGFATLGLFLLMLRRREAVRVARGERGLLRREQWRPLVFGFLAATSLVLHFAAFMTSTRMTTVAAATPHNPPRDDRADIARARCCSPTTPRPRYVAPPRSGRRAGAYRSQLPPPPGRHHRRQHHTGTMPNRAPRRNGQASARTTGRR